MGRSTNEAGNTLYQAPEEGKDSIDEREDDIEERLDDSEEGLEDALDCQRQWPFVYRYGYDSRGRDSRFLIRLQRVEEYSTNLDSVEDAFNEVCHCICDV
jgi:hypothetical protein